MGRWRGHLFIPIADAGTGMLPRPDSPGLDFGMPVMALMADDVHVASRGELAGTMVSLRFSLEGSGASVPPTTQLATHRSRYLDRPCVSRFASWRKHRGGGAF